MTELIFSIFANLQVGKYAEYCISSNKHLALNKHHSPIVAAQQFQNLLSIGIVQTPKGRGSKFDYLPQRVESKTF